MSRRIDRFRIEKIKFAGNQSHELYNYFNNAASETLSSVLRENIDSIRRFLIISNYQCARKKIYKHNAQNSISVGEWSVERGVIVQGIIVK